MGSLQQRADILLDSLKNLRNSRACYPCAKRKIRCEGSYPCHTCTQRGHTEICFVPEGKPAQHAADRGKKRRGMKSRERTAAPNTPSENSTTGAASLSDLRLSPTSTKSHRRPPGEQRNNEPRNAPTVGRTEMGQQSLAAYLRDSLRFHNPQVSQDVRPSLGLENQSLGEPLLKAPIGLSSSTDALFDTLPKREEVREFFPQFRSFVAPFYPIIDDVDSFELRIIDMVDQYETTHAQNPSQLHILLETSAADVSLFLSTLALGSQFSQLSSSERARQGQDLGYLVQRAESFLHLSNYIIKPRIETVQTLLFIGLYMQNAGQADGAWSLLGLTFRFAQALGLQGNGTRPEHSLWGAIIWQDCLLSLRFDRRPFSPAAPTFSQRVELDHAGIAPSYLKSMLSLHAICLCFLSTEEQERLHQSYVTTQVGQIDEMLTVSAPHLQNEKTSVSLQQRLEFHAMRMHSSFLVAELCRPFLTQASLDNRSRLLRTRCVQSCQDNVQAYIDMSKLSILPSRSWSLMHEALSCACVLALIQATCNDSTVPNILDHMMQLLEGIFRHDGNDEHLVVNWPLYRGMRLLERLREFASTVKGVASSSSQPPHRANLDGVGNDGVRSHQDATDPAIENEGTSALFGAPFDGFDESELEPTWMQPLFAETGLDNANLSSFLNTSSDLLEMFKDLPLLRNQEEQF